MKIIITKENLIKALQKIIGVVDKKQSMPILSHILFKKSNEGYEVVASDLEVQLSSVIEVNDVNGFAGNITIPGRKLFDIGKGLSDESLIEIDQINESKIQIKSKKSKFILSALDPNTFPMMETLDDESISFSMKASELKEIIGKTSFAMAQQDVRYYLNGLYLLASNNQISTVATDGHRLAKASISAEGKSLEGISAIVPRKGVIEIDKQLDEEEEEINIILSKNHIKVSNKKTMAISKLIDGSFPDYTKVMPTNVDKKVIVDNKLFKEALIRVSILSNDRFRGVRLNFINNEIKVSANNPEKEEASDDIKSNYEGDNLEVGFNVNYLIDVLNVIKTKNVQILLRDANSSALLTPENDNSSSYVVMPLRL